MPSTPLAHRRQRYAWTILVVLCIGLLAITFLIWTGPAIRGWTFPERSEETIGNFARTTAPAVGDYQSLVEYFAEGFLAYRDDTGSGAAFPGWPSSYGATSDRLEGFSRSIPLMAAWLSRDRAPRLRLKSGQLVDLRRVVHDGIVAGTDPGSTGYWGAIGDRDQRIVEAADIALSLWLTKTQIWPQLSRAERDRVAAWLRGVNEKETADNNWHLFVVLVNLVLRDLGEDHDLAEAQRRYERARSFYRGDGWFSDGPGRQFDYYNAWGFHYTLFWIDQIDPSLDHDFIRTALDAVSVQLKHMVGPHGLPIMGRSVCYRMAAIAPLVMAAATDSTSVSAGEARRALDLVWRYFAGRGAIRDGSISQGYCGDDPRLLDSYSGPASCLWSLRSLVAALYLADSHAFWAGPVGRLPVEERDFILPLAVPGWQLTGDHETLDVVLSKPVPDGRLAPALSPYTLASRVKTQLTGRPYRPANHAAKYDRASYGSRDPFCGCPD